jgi:hypothetical protein
MNRALQAGLTGFATVAVASLQPAAARILCDGEFQISKYGPIATPYCGDQVIARVAHEYGWRESAAQVGSNPPAKVYICQTLATDWRLQGPCAGYSSCHPR